MGTYVFFNIGIVTDSGGMARTIARQIEDEVCIFGMEEYIEVKSEKLYGETFEEEVGAFSIPHVVRIKIRVLINASRLCKLIVWRVLRDYQDLTMYGFSNVEESCVGDLTDDPAWVAGVPEQWKYWDNLKKEFADIAEEVLNEK
jgi:hypothetical protein